MLHIGQDEKCIGQDEKCIGQDEKCIGQDEKCIGQDEKCIGQDEKCIGQDEKCIGQDEKCIGQDKKCIGQNEKFRRFNLSEILNPNIGNRQIVQPPQNRLVLSDGVIANHPVIMPFITSFIRSLLGCYSLASPKEFYEQRSPLDNDSVLERKEK